MTVSIGSKLTFSPLSPTCFRYFSQEVQHGNASARGMEPALLQLNATQQWDMCPFYATGTT